MKSLLLGSASVLAVVLGLSGSANAQVLGDLDGLGAALGGVLDDVNIEELNAIDISALNGLDISVLPENLGEGGIYLNTAANIAPQLATNVNVGVPLGTGDGSAFGGIVAALGIALSPETGSGAVAIDTTGLADLIAAVGSSITTGDQTATAVGVLANQATQNASTSIATLTDNSTLNTDGGSLDLSDEATQANAQAGSAASSAAARLTTLNVTGPTLDLDNDIDASDIDGALQGVYAANTALNLAPQIAANINTATSITAQDLSATAVGVLANQTISIGLDGAALSGSLTGNYPGATDSAD